MSNTVKGSLWYSVMLFDLCAVVENQYCCWEWYTQMSSRLLLGQSHTCVNYPLLAESNHVLTHMFEACHSVACTDLVVGNAVKLETLGQFTTTILNRMMHGSKWQLWSCQNVLFCLWYIYFVKLHSSQARDEIWCPKKVMLQGAEYGCQLEADPGITHHRHASSTTYPHYNPWS